MAAQVWFIPTKPSTTFLSDNVTVRLTFHLDSQNLSFVLSAPYTVSYADQPVPTLGPTDVLIRIAYTGICGSDVHFYTHGGIGSYKLTSPLVLGHEPSGTVVKIGSSVKNLCLGDRVCLEPGTPCRKCIRCKEGKYHLCKDMIFAASPPYPGTLAKFYALPEDFCYKLPESVTLQEGALVEPLSVAVHIVKQANVQPGQSVVVFGAGPVGLLCGAVARIYGATTVVAVDINQSRLDFAASYAATRTFMPPSENLSAKDFAAQLVEECALGDGADAVIDASGAEACIRAGIYAARVGGTFVQGGMGKNDVDFPIMEMCMKELNVKGGFRYGTGDYQLAVAILAQGKISVKELITEIVPFTHAEQGIKNMKSGKGIKTLIRGVED